MLVRPCRAEALTKRALKDYPPKENNFSVVEGIGNLSARKQHVMNMSSWKKGAIETHFKMYPELKKMRAEVRKEWQETLAEARDEWKQKAEENAQLATLDEE